MSVSPPVQRPPAGAGRSGGRRDRASGAPATTSRRPEVSRGARAQDGGALVPPARGAGWPRFVTRHGWRAYALPLLVVLTILALAWRGSSPPARPNATAPAGATTGPPATTVASGTGANTLTTGATGATDQVQVEATGGGEQLAADELPPGANYTSRGSGTFEALKGSSAAFGRGPLRRFDIEVERGVSGVDTKAFAQTVMTTLTDKRSWTGDGSFSLQRVATAADADFHISLTSPITLRAPCQYDLKIETSCWHQSGGVSRVYLNLARWVRGDTQFGQDLSMYRLYMVNHEVGHALGHVHTFKCLPDGLAPVMMQQTITLHEDQGLGAKICQPNVWPFPPGVDPKVAVPS